MKNSLKKGITNVPPLLVDLVRTRSLERIDSKIKTQSYEISKSIPVTENEIRVLGGVLDPKGETAEEKIKALEIEKKHWRELAETEEASGDKRKASFHRSISKTAALKADKIRIEENQRPESEEAQSILDEEIETNDLTRFERFKKWVKENLGAISVIAISVGGIITTIIVGARSAIAKGARATSSFAKALAKLAGKAGPVLGAMLNLIGSILSLGAKGVEFLSRNLWMLAIALAYFLYYKFKNRKRER